MRKPFSFILLSFSVALVMFFSIAKSVLADGMIMKFDPYSDRWDYSKESNQQAYINYDNGLQKMIISVGFAGENSSGTVWLFPVPAEPDKVAIDIVINPPGLIGEEISKKAKYVHGDTLKYLQMTQLYTIPFVIKSLIFGTTGTKDSYYDYGFQGQQIIEGGVKHDVVVYEHMEKEGIITEIITAETANGLYDYLKNKGLIVKSGSIPVLDHYIGREFSFVASWISPSEKIISAEDIGKNFNHYFSDRHCYPKFFSLAQRMKLKYPEFNKARYPADYLMSQQGRGVLLEITQAIQNEPSIVANLCGRNKLSDQRGVFVAFPTKKIYYPLIPTSVYGRETVPATIRLIGHVTPIIFKDIRKYTQTEYYIGKYSGSEDGLKSFLNGQNQNIKYTKITINAPSKFFTDDLWLKAQAPAITYYYSFVVKHPVIYATILLLLSSIIAGILSGLINFRGLRGNPFKLGLIGLSNLLSIVGLMIATALVGTKNKNEKIEPILFEMKQKGYFWKRRVVTILFFISIPFYILNICLITLYIKFLFIAIFILPIAIIIAIFILQRIKPEDKYLFEQLKLLNYSPWSFKPKDRSKIAFVAVFSILFLNITWLLINFVAFDI